MKLFLLTREAGLLQGVEHSFVIKIAGHFKSLHALGGGVARYARHGSQGFVHSLDAFAAAKMQAFNFDGLHFLIFRAGVGVDFNSGIAALAKITGGHERVRTFLNRGHVRPGQDHGVCILIRLGGQATDIGGRFGHAFDTRLTTQVNIGDGDGDICGIRRKREAQCQDDGSINAFHKFSVWFALTNFI